MTGAAPDIRVARHQMYETVILDTAELLFAQRGIDACQVKDVATTAGISLSTQYKYFRSKEDLLRAVHVRRLKVLMKCITESVRPQATALKEMLHANEAYMRFHMDYPNYLGMHLREGNAWFETDRLRCPEQVEAFEKGLRRAIKSFKAGIKERIFVDEPPSLMAHAAIAANQVHLSYWVTSGSSEPQDTVIHRAHSHFVRAFCLPECVTVLLDELSRSGQ